MRWLLTASFWVVALAWSSGALVVKLPANLTVPAVLMFGDSIVDTGNNNDNVLSPARANFPPYGQDFPGKVSTGRYSNGKVPSDFIVESLRIKDLLPPYADPNLKPEDLLTGVCFAVGGVGYDPLTSKLASVPVLNDQLHKLEEYTAKLNKIAGPDRTSFILTNSISFVVLSSNDIANTYFGSRLRTVQYDVPSYCDFLVSGASEFFRALYSKGIRRMAIVGAPPIGCVPSQRTLGGGANRDCFEAENDMAKIFNTRLSSELDRLNKIYTDARMVYVDSYYPLLDIIQHPNKYGFKIGNKGCCGTGVIEAAILCNPFDTTCMDDRNYVFWDAYHPTEKTYKIFIDDVITKYVDKFV